MISLVNGFPIMIASLRIFLIVLFSLWSVSRAAEVYPFYMGARMAAMGGASIAVVNDETALLSNPAGLGKVRNFFGTILDPEIEFTPNSYNITRNNPSTNLMDLNSLYPLLQNNKGTHYHARAQIFPSVVVRNFGIGIYGRSLLDAELNEAGTSLDTHYWNDLALALGYNLRLFEGRIKIGLSTKLINRIEIAGSLDPTSSLATKDVGSEGLGISTDAGLILTAPIYWLPTLSVVVRDMGGTKFESGSGLRLSTLARPNPATQDYDVALAVFPIHGNHTRSSWTVEMKGVTASQKTGEDTTRHLHMGAELNMADILFVRAGMYQRYATGGIELASEHWQFQFSTYGADIGTVGSPKEDRRYILKFALRF